MVLPTGIRSSFFCHVWSRPKYPGKTKGGNRSKQERLRDNRNLVIQPEYGVTNSGIAEERKAVIGGTEYVAGRLKGEDT